MALRNTAAVVAFAARILYGQVDVLTAQYNISRTSSNTQEVVLNRANVNNAQFGKLFSRTVDAPFYASPLIVTNLNLPAVGARNVVYIATLANTVYAFDADDPNPATPYWSVNLGTPISTGCCFLGPTLGILGTPVIDRSTNTIYLAAIVKSADVGLYVFALDLSTGAVKFNSPQRITYRFPSGVIKTDATEWLQRAGLLLFGNVLYVATSNVMEIDGVHSSQEGFITTFKATDLSVQLASFETTPSGEGGGIWQAARGLTADSSGNVFVAVDSGAYNPPNSFGDSVIKFGSGTLSPLDWFTPANWSFLQTNNLDLSANGVTLMPQTNLAFAGGKTGVIYLLDQTSLGGLESVAGSAPMQEFQAAPGCTASCGSHLPTAYWPHATSPYLYVWDVSDFLRAFPFDPVSQRFVTVSATVGTLLPSRTGGMTISSNGSIDGTGIVWAATAALNPFTSAVPGTLRAYNANDITQELYNSDQNSSRDAMGTFVKMSTPIVANGKVYVNTQSNILPVYGLLAHGGALHVTVSTLVNGPTIAVDGGAPFTGSQGFDWALGSNHTLTTSSQQSGGPGTQFLWQNWSDGGSISHSVTVSTLITTYTATFRTQYQLTTQVSLAGAGSISPGTGLFDAGSIVPVIATPAPGFIFTGFSGALTERNPQSLTMSAPLTVTANFRVAAGSAGFLAAYALNSPVLRSNFSGWVGMKLMVGASALKVSSLGRVCVAGNSGTHTVKFVDAITGGDVPGGSAPVSMTGCSAGQFQYATLASPITLAAGASYYLASQELSGGDQWYDHGTVVTLPDAAVTSSTYFNGASWMSVDAANTSYVPLDFQYTFAPPDPNPPFITGYNLNNRPSRNNFSGWLGMKLTVGASPVTVNALGRLFLTGNSGTHTVKFVRASDGADLPGGSVSIPTAGGTAGQFKYVALISPITLQANTPYYLVSQEMNGGDTWYDHGAISTTNVAAVNSSIYLTGTTWTSLDGPNTSYVPLSFTYGASAGTIAVTVQTSPVGRSFTVDGTAYTATQILNWTPGSTHTVATTSPQSGGAGTQYVWSSWSDASALSHTVAPGAATTFTANFATQYLLTTGVAPGSSGSSTANPFSATNYYDSGTSVQLTATPNAGNTFTNWSGDSSGSTNPQTVTMSAPRTVTANFHLPGGTWTSFLTGFALNAPSQRNNFSGWVGMKLTVGANPLTVSALGRIFLTGNSGTHTVKFVRASDGGDVPGGSVSIPMAGGTAGQFKYVPLISPITLQANTVYYLVSQEVNGGDTWYNHGAISTTNVAAVNSSVYLTGTTWTPLDGPNTSYVPLSFEY